jgi:7-cyano-7-deazaguanine tRNA-ribosyltransferase
MYETIASDLHGRLGSFKIPREDVTTPTLVPVLDPKNNIITATEMKEKFGFNLVITSAYLFLKRYGVPDGKKTIHDYLGFKSNIMMDSGAYQILAYGDVEIEPIQSLEIQAKLNADIGVILDIPTPPDDSYQQAQKKMEETLNRIKISLDFISQNQDVIWTLPIQGGKNVDLINKYVSSVNEKGYLKHFGFHALGSVVPIMSQYDYVSLFSMIKEARRLLPYDTPFHLFGAGHPMIFPFIVALGCDTFDSAAYVLYAKEGRYMTSFGTHHLSDLIELPCSCEICSKWTSKELLNAENEIRIRNISLHNLYVSTAEIKNIRIALKEGRLWELLELKSKSHPNLYKAFKFFIEDNSSNYFEFGTPITKQVGLKIYDEISFYRPELSKVRRRIYEKYSTNSSKLIILISSGKRNPMEILNRKTSIRKIIDTQINQLDFAVFLPFMGLVPIELVETFPFSQFVFSSSLTAGLLKLSSQEVLRFIEKMNYNNIQISLLDNDNISKQLLNLISDLLKTHDLDVNIIDLKFINSD